MKDEYFEITNDSGETVLCQKLGSFTKNNEDYLLYTDFEVDNNGEIEVLAAKIKKVNEKIEFEPITDEETWAMIDKKWKEINNE